MDFPALLPLRSRRFAGSLLPLCLLMVFFAGKAAAAEDLEPSAAATTATVKGTVEFEDVPLTKKGFNFDAPHKPKSKAIGVLVQLVGVESNTIFAHTSTTSAGAYSFTVSVPAEPVFVRVWAEAGNAKVVNEPEAPSEYFIASPYLHPKAGKKLTENLLARDADRGDGPFNILDAIRKANALLLSVDPGIHLPDVIIHWAPDYKSGTGTSINDHTIHLNGDRSVESVEMNDVTIDHEYGHYLLATFSRDDSPIGVHTPNTPPQNPALSWSEGWATFFGCASNGTSQYIHTMANGALDFIVDLELIPPFAGETGYWQESAVSSMLWHLWESGHGPRGDYRAGLGFAPIWHAITSMKSGSYPVYFIDFCDALVNVAPTTGAAITQVLAPEGITYSPGQLPSIPNPWVVQIPGFLVPESGIVTSYDTRRDNLLASRDVYRLSLFGASALTIKMEVTAAVGGAPETLGVWVFDHAGELVTSDWGNKLTITTEKLPRGDYAIEVRSFNQQLSGDETYGAGQYTLTVNGTSDGGGGCFCSTPSDEAPGVGTAPEPMVAQKESKPSPNTAQPPADKPQHETKCVPSDRPSTSAGSRSEPHARRDGARGGS